MADLVFLHGHRTQRCDAVVAKRFLGYLTLQYCHEGAVVLAYDERETVLRGQWTWPAFPGPFIRFRAAPGTRAWDHRYVAVAGPLANRWFADGLFPHAPQPAPAGHRIDRHFDELYPLMHRADRWGRLRAINLLERILLELADARAQPAEREPWLATVLDRLDDPARRPGAAALARLAGLGESTLRRRFRRATGASPNAFVIAQRIGEARRLLAETDLAVAAIAERLGYADASFFSRQFRRHAGVAPALFRRSARQ